MGTKEEIGKKVKAVRESKKLTQVEAAEKAGVSVNYFARLERGEVNPSSEIIGKIAKAFGVKSSSILPF